MSIINAARPDRLSVSVVVAASDSLRTRKADYVCDGQDDQVQIQAALAEAAGHGAVLCLGGTYVIQQAISVPENSCLRGEGFNTILKLADGAGANVLELGNGSDDWDEVILEDFAIDGNQANNTYSSADLHHGISGDKLQFCNFRNLFIHDCLMYGIYLTGSASDRGITISDCHFFNQIGSTAGQCAIKIAGASEFNRVVGCHFEDNKFGISTDGANNVFTGCTFKGGHYGIKINTATNCGKCIVSGCHFAHCGRTALTIEDANRVIVIGCWIGANYYHGIHLKGSDNCIIANNFLGANNVIAGAYHDVHIESTASNNAVDNKIRGNVFDPYATQKVQYCINEADADCANTIEQNHFTQAGASGVINKQGTNTVVRQNTGYVTEACGTATVANLQTSVAVSHGLDVTPALEDIQVTPTNDLGNAAKFYVADPTASDFDIHVDADPGAGTATFAWSIKTE